MFVVLQAVFGNESIAYIVRKTALLLVRRAAFLHDRGRAVLEFTVAVQVCGSSYCVSGSCVGFWGGCVGLRSSYVLVCVRQLCLFERQPCWYVMQLCWYVWQQCWCVRELYYLMVCATAVLNLYELCWCMQHLAAVQAQWFRICYPNPSSSSR